MQNTMTLLDSALAQKPAPFWTEKLKLSRSALHTAKTRGHLSPAIAGALAEELGQDPKEWIVVAALESERDSACKDRMIKAISSRIKSKITGFSDVIRGYWILLSQRPRLSAL